MAQYDEKVLLEFAEKLYQQAVAVIITTTMKYGMVTLVFTIAGSFLAENIRSMQGAPLGLFSIVATVIATLVGIVRGRERAFLLKLQAQEMLLQLQIERNTRK